MAGELLNTEVNYVRILKTLCHKYKSGLEDETQRTFIKSFQSCLHIYLVNGPILNHTESKLIFGNIPELLKIHENLLKDIEIIIDELTIGKNRSLGNHSLHHKYCDKPDLGKCFLKYTEAEAFGKAYSSYIQFMKQSKYEVDRMKGTGQNFLAIMLVSFQLSLQAFVDSLSAKNTLVKKFEP